MEYRIATDRDIDVMLQSRMDTLRAAAAPPAARMQRRFLNHKESESGMKKGEKDAVYHETRPDRLE